MNFGDTIPASSFMRQAAGPTFYVKQGLSGRRDVAPPSRVIDFHVSSIVNDSLYVELQWSAPGDNYDQGKGENNIVILFFGRYHNGQNDQVLSKQKHKTFLNF